MSTELNSIISPEIKDDDFYAAISNIAKNESIKTVLEIGSSSGQGSTAAFVEGLRQNINHPELFCLEVSKVRFKALQDFYINDTFVHCYNVSSISVRDFPEPEDIIDFYEQKETNLNKHDLKEILGWLSQDITYLIDNAIVDNGIQKIKRDNNIEFFDVVLIDGSEFTGSTELNEVYGAKVILLDDINSYKNYESHRRLLADSNYQLIEENRFLRNGYSIFKRKDFKEFKISEFPINFFTIVLNGQPFIRYHIEVFRLLPFPWHWHIVEGVADLKHDTSWSLSSGGRIDNSNHSKGLSNDGTTEYLDQLVLDYPNQVTIYRKPEGMFWDGKREMVNAPLCNINEECLLWQVDVDELWTIEQIQKAHQLFLENPDKTAAFYWCWYFVGKNLIVSSRNCYSQNPQQEWLRTWRFRPGMHWAKHEPPVLVDSQNEDCIVDVAKANPFLHSETEQHGLSFQHFAYVMPEQLLFKETYYGYKNALSQWQSLQAQRHFPVFLADYFTWVKDDTVIDLVDDFGVVPIAFCQDSNKNWVFRDSSEIFRSSITKETITYKIAIDAVFFQLLKSGIGRVWRSLFQEWVSSGFAKHFLILDRARTAPKIPGLRYRFIPPYDECRSGNDSQLLQQICEQEGIDLFISTYYTAPTTIPTAILVYDMIPEVMQADSSTPAWREKHFAILHATTHLTISKNTEFDLLKFFPHISPNTIQVAYCAVSDDFLPGDPLSISTFLDTHGIDSKYFLVVGDRFGFNGYKNVLHFFKAFSQMPDHESFSIVCVGGRAELESELASLIPHNTVHLLQLSDHDLAIAYSGAIAMVYPSRYEGFGMPVLEAMACACPVITCKNSSLPEVAGEAALYVSEDNVEELVQALVKIQNPTTRATLIAAGLEQAKKFSWEKMAGVVAEVLLETCKRLSDHQVEQPTQVWAELRKIQSELQRLQSSTLSEPYQPNLPDLTSANLNLDPELQSLLARIAAIESTKFWKLRSLFVFFKKLRRPTLLDDEVRIDADQSVEMQLLQARARINWMQTSKFWKLRNSWFEFKHSLGLPAKE